MQTTFAIAVLLFIFSCNTNEEKRPLSFAPKVVKAHGYEVPKDSMAEPKAVPTGKPTVVRAGKPKVVPTNTNVYPAGIPKIVMAGVPRVCTPGQDSFSLPKKVPAIDSPFIAGIPEVVIAKDAYAKDENPQNFSSFGKLQGLKSDAISCLMEDKRGNLWIGTNWGASKYDGKSFTHFTVKEGLGSNVVDCILEDKSGNLWFGTFGEGVSKYDGKSFTHFTEKEGLSNNYVSGIVEDTSGNLWLVTQGGVNKYDGKSFTHFSDKQGLSNQVVSILANKDGNVWFGTIGSGAIKYDGKSFTHFTKKEGLSDGVGSILMGKNGNLWFAIDGVSKYDGKSFTHFTKKEGLIENGALSMLEDKSGNLWFCTGNGVRKYNGKSFTHFTEKEGLSDNRVLSILEDKRGNLWLGTSKGGIIKYGGERFTHYTKGEGLSNNRVLSILQDKSSNLWFGTHGGGVNKYDGKSFTHFTKKEGMTINVVYSMLEDKSGNLWFSHWGGVSKYDGKNFTRFDIPGMDVKSMLQDKSGNLWFGTYEEGVFKYDGKRFTRFTVKEGLSNNIVRCIYEDKNGNLWFGTQGGGVSKYDPAEGRKSFTHFTEKEGLLNNSVFSILEDNSGNLWFGSLGGVSKYDGKNFTHFTEKEGLSNNIVLSIMEDKSGNLWFGTRFGLSKLEKDKIASGLSDPELLFKTYTYEDGFSGFDVNSPNSMYEAKDGTIWVGAGERLTAFHPGEDTPDTIPPDMQLTGLSLFNENISWQNLVYRNGVRGHGPDTRRDDVNDTSIVLSNGVGVHDFHFDGVSKWYGVPEQLSLAYNNNYLTFQFVGITTQSPKKVKYKFKLEGLDKNWSALTNRTEAPYGNLPHGKYTFKVKAMNGDGYWSKELNYSFTIRPPWWRTWWAYTLLALVFIGIIYALFRYRLNQVRIQHEIVLQKHKASELEMQALRAQMNPHFIFNSLNSINMFILENNKLQASEYLSKFSRLVRLILQNSRKTLIPLEKELEALQLYLELEALRFDQRFEYKILMDDEVDTTVLKVPPLIIQPYAENAIWHGLMHKKEKGHLEIELYQEKEILNCKITDDGIGRKKAAELRSKSTSTHHSMGIKITESRIAMMQKMNGSDRSVEIKDLVRPDGGAAGTEVLIKIPLCYD